MMPDPEDPMGEDWRDYVDAIGRSTVTPIRPDVVVEEPWPERKKIESGCEPVPSMDAAMLPWRLRDWIVDVAEHACLPIEMVAMPAVSVLGTVVGRKFVIEPSPGFHVAGNIWSLFVAPPASKKSAALSAGKAPLGPLIARAREDHRQNALKLKARAAAIKQRIRKAERGDAGGVDEALLMEIYQELDRCNATERRYTTSDSTVAALGELLIQNPNGLLVCRDEIAGLFAMLDDPRAPGDREFYLEGWVGTGDHTLDRIGRGLNLYIPSHCLSVAGATQPGKIRRLVSDAVDDGSKSDGLLQRFQLFVWPDRLPAYRRCGAPLDIAARDRAYGVFSWLASAEPAGVSDTVSDRGWCTMRFDGDAQAVYDAWLDSLESRLRESEELTAAPAYAAHLGKYRSLAPKLAMLFHLAGELDASPIGVDAMNLALDWIEYLIPHARKLYAEELTPGSKWASHLGAKIEAGAVVHGDTVRSLYKPRWAGLETPEKVAGALDTLEDAGWVRLAYEVGPRGGRPSAVVHLHPDLRGRATP